MPAFISDLETRLEEEYAKRKREFEERRRVLLPLRREQYNAATTNQEKAVIDPVRFLTEQDGKVTVLRGVNGMFHIRRMARSLYLHVEFMEDDVRKDELTVIGKREDVEAEIERIRRAIIDGKAEMRKRSRREATACHEEFVRTGGGDGNITGPWYLDIPEFDAWREEIMFKEGESSMVIAPHQPNNEFLWGSMVFSGSEGWLKIHLPEHKFAWNTEMQFSWQIEYDEYDDGEVGHQMPNRGVVMFESPSMCVGTIKGWVGGPFRFRGFKGCGEATADTKECETKFNHWQEIEDEYREHYMGSESDQEEYEYVDGKKVPVKMDLQDDDMSEIDEEQDPSEDDEEEGLEGDD